MSDAERGVSMHIRPTSVAAAIPLSMLLCATLCGCSRYAGGPNLDAADALWLPDEAHLEKDAAKPILVRNGRSIYVDGTASVTFTIDSVRETLSERIVQHFAAAGWRQRSTEYLNPQRPTSFEAGWGSQCACVLFQIDPQSEPAEREPFHQWHGEWENEPGDIITYTLGGTGTKLRGHAGYVTRAVVERSPHGGVGAR